MEETIIILTHVNKDNSPYCSFVHSHAKGLKSLGYNVVVLATLGWIPFIRFIKKGLDYNRYKGTKVIDGITVKYIKKFSMSTFLMKHKINFNGIFYYFAIKKDVAKILKTENVKFIDAHTFRAEGYAAYKLKKKYKKPTIITIHGTSFLTAYENDYGKKEMLKFGEVIDSYVCVSEKLEKYFIDMNIKNVKVIYNGIYNFPLHRRNDNYNIITIAALTDRKRISYIISAFDIILKKYPQAHLTVVGTGKLETELKQKAKNLKLQDKIMFTGQLENKEVYKLLSGSRIFTLISINEGFGIVYPESMYAGCIPIATKHEGIDGFIRNGYNGFLIESSVNHLAKTIEYIFENDCKDIRKKAIQSAKSLTWENNAKKYLKIIEDKYGKK